MRSLNSSQSARQQTKHLCPLPFDIVDRAITQFSMPGETVYDPFAGIGTVPARAVKLGRRGMGTELSEASFRDAVYYCGAAEKQADVPTLFDMTEPQSEEESVPA
jgi:DNA modification methylase